MKTNLIIAIDGGAATGKSTLAKGLAKKMNLELINSGLFYRYATLLAMQKNLLNNLDELAIILSNTNFEYKDEQIFSKHNLDNSKLNSLEVSENVSEVSSDENIRRIVTNILRNIASQKDCIMEGRDISTIVLPNATHKFFVTVSNEEAAKRRFNELQKKGDTTTFEEVLANIKHRNELDSNRLVAPLKKAVDAIEISTDGKTPEELVVILYNFINEHSK